LNPLLPLASLFQRQRPVLFLGAGPSIGANGPSWGRLATDIATHFKIQPGPMKEVCDKLCRFNARRREVEDFIETRLTALSPTQDILDLLDFPWEAVFTTNYDMIPEVASGLAFPSGRRIVVRDDGRNLRSPPDGSLPVYKIMGSCNRRYPDPGWMQVSESDIRKGYEARKPYIQLLRRLMAERDLLILGSSLEDGLLFDLFEDIANETGNVFENAIILVTPNVPNPDVSSKLKEYGIRHLQLDTRALVKQLQAEKIEAPAPGGRVVAIAGRSHVLSSTLEAAQAYAGQLIDRLYEGESFSSRADFYKRSAYSRAAFDAMWDFHREFKVTHSGTKKGLGISLKVPTAIERMVKTAAVEELPTYLLVGPAGSAKTMTSLRMIHDWVGRGELALYVDGGKDMFIAETTADFLTEVLQQLAMLNKNSPSKSKSGPKVLVVLDNCALNLNGVKHLARCLRRNGVAHQVVLLITGHPGDITPRERDYFTETWALPPYVSVEELVEFRGFIKANAPDLSPNFVETVLSSPEKKTFFELLYQLIEPTRGALEGSVLREFDTLPSWEKDLVALVATFQAHRLPIPEQIAWRFFPTKSLTEISLEIEEGRLHQVLYRTQGHPFMLLSCLPQTVANTIFNEKVRTKGKRASDVITSVIRMVHKEPDEVQFLQDQLILHLSSKERDSPLDRKEVERVLEVAATHFDSRAMYHHYGKVLMKNGKFSEAEAALEHAIKAYWTGEKAEFIYHSLGELYRRWAERMKESDALLALAYVAKAKDKFRLSRADQSNYATLGLAKLQMVEAELTQDHKERRRILLDALRQTDMGRVTASDREEKEMFLKVRRDIVSLLADDVLELEEARELARSYRTSDGFLFLIDRSVGEKDPCHLHQSELSSLLNVVTEGLTFAPLDPSLLLWRVRLLYVLDPHATMQMMEVLRGLTGRVPESHRALLSAKVYAAASDFKSALAEMRRALSANTEGLAPIEWSNEVLVRDEKGPRRFTVTSSKKGVAVVSLSGDIEVDCPGFDVGETVVLGVTLRGFLPTIPPHD